MPRKRAESFFLAVCSSRYSTSHGIIRVARFCQSIRWSRWFKLSLRRVNAYMYTHSERWAPGNSPVNTSSNVRNKREEEGEWDRESDFGLPHFHTPPWTPRALKIDAVCDLHSSLPSPLTFASLTRPCYVTSESSLFLLLAPFLSVFHSHPLRVLLSIRVYLTVFTSSNICFCHKSIVGSIRRLDCLLCCRAPIYIVCNQINKW